MPNPQELLARVARGEDDGTAINDLIGEFYRGHPVETLLPLLRSDSDEVTSSATWLASELGERALSLTAELSELLRHSSPRVRFWAVDAIWGLGPTADSEATARAALAVRDEHSGVRWKAMNLLARLSAERLHAAADHWRLLPNCEVLLWLVECDRTENAKAITEQLNAADTTQRLVAAAAAARLALNDPTPLQKAIGVDDEEVQTFARERLDDLEQEWYRSERRADSMDVSDAKLKRPATNQDSWAWMIRFMARLSDVPALAGWARIASSLLRQGQALRLDEYFRTGQSMQYLVFTTKSRFVLVDEPRVTVCWPNGDSAAALTGERIEVSIGHENRWFSEPDRADIVSGDDAWAAVAAYLLQLWHESKDGLPAPAGLPAHGAPREH